MVISKWAIVLEVCGSPTVNAIDFMPCSENCQVSYEEEIKEKLDIGRLFVMLELQVILKGIITAIEAWFRR
jgi:hypothetical protein